MALARVLVRERPVLLLDEPFASLGPALRADMLALVAELNRERGMTVLMATHSPEDAEAIAGQVLFLDNGEVAAAGPPSAFFADGRACGVPPLCRLARPSCGRLKIGPRCPLDVTFSCKCADSFHGPTRP